jgi:hypothetical protein
LPIGPRETDALLFLDETGTSNYFSPAKLAKHQALIRAGLKPTTSTIFGLGGVLIRRADYRDFHEALRVVKSRHFGTADFALHEFDIRNMKKPPFNILRDEAVWWAFYADLGALIAGTDFRVVVATIDKIAMQETYPPPLSPYHPYQYSLHVIVERVINERAFGETCRIVAENRHAGLNKELTTELLNLQFNGGSINGRATVSAEQVRARIDPTIVFRNKDDFDSGLEIADLCAGPVTRWLHGLKGSASRDVLPIVRPKLRQSVGGKLRGFGVKCLPDYPDPCPT